MAVVWGREEGCGQEKRKGTEKIDGRFGPREDMRGNTKPFHSIPPLPKHSFPPNMAPSSPVWLSRCIAALDEHFGKGTFEIRICNGSVHIEHTNSIWGLNTNPNREAHHLFICHAGRESVPLRDFINDIIVQNDINKLLYVADCLNRDVRQYNH